MSDPTDLRNLLATAFYTPRDLEEILERFGRLDLQVAAEELSRKDALELKAYAFHAMRRATVGDPATARRLIRESLLPHCLLILGEDDAESRASLSDFREELSSWIDDFDEPGRSDARAEVMRELRRALEGPGFRPACWTVAEIGFRDPMVVEALWDRAEGGRGGRASEGGEEAEDVALYVLSGLGLGGADRERLALAICNRAESRCNHYLINAMRRLADERFLGAIRDRWVSPDRPPRSLEVSLMARVPADVAEAYPGRPEVQERAWDLVHAIREAAADCLRDDFYLGSDLAPRIDSPRVVPDLLRLLLGGGVDRESQQLRYLAYRRLGECLRPGQLAGWIEPLAPGLLELVRADAYRDTRSPGIYRTVAIDVKKHAWSTLLSAADPAMPTAASFEAALVEEASPHVRSYICGLLAGFRLDRPPEAAVRWAGERVDAGRDGFLADLLHRSASAEVLASVATRPAFDALLGFGFTIDGAALLSTLRALAEIGLWLARRGDEAVRDAVAAEAEHGEHRNNRVAAAEVLAALASEGLLDRRHYAFIPAALRQEKRDDSELGRLIEAIGPMPRDLLTPELEADLVRLSRGDGQAAANALEALARQGRLAGQPDLLRAVLGLEFEGGVWAIRREAARVERASSVLGLLYAEHPDSFAGAACEAIKTWDWAYAARLVHQLDGLFGTRDARPLPPAVRDALVERIRRRQTRTTAETEVFRILGRWDPACLALLDWPASWKDWLSDARVALADALCEVAWPDEEARRAAILHARSLTNDGQYAVRRAAFRTLARLAPEWLRVLCEMSSIDPARGGRTEPDVPLRRRGAEACAWLDSDESYALYAERFVTDPERSVREAARRVHSERAERRLAEAYLAEVLTVRTGEAREMLAAWRYGRALAALGDDSTSRALRGHLESEDLPPSVRHWLAGLADQVDDRWKKVAQGWPEPWIPIEGSIEEGQGALEVGGSEIPIRYSLWKQPARRGSETSSWGGVATADGPSPRLLMMPVEVALILSNGARGDISVARSSLDRLEFSGNGPYPR